MESQIQRLVIKQLCGFQSFQEEKKFFQMELVNRETNFNKVFSASPNVGVLNPLDAKVSIYTIL